MPPTIEDIDVPPTIEGIDVPPMVEDIDVPPRVEDIDVLPRIVDCGSDWRVDYARGPASFFVKRVYPTRSDVQAILDSAATGPDVVIWPSAGQAVSSRI